MTLWVQALIAAFSLGREFFKYLQEKEQSKKSARHSLIELNKKVKKAVKGKNTNELSQAFLSVGIGSVQDAKPDADGNSGS